MKKMSPLSVFAAGVLCIGTLQVFASQAQSDVQTSPRVIREDHHDTSLPFRELTRPRAPAQTNPSEHAQALPLRRTHPPITSTEPDPVLQAFNVLPGITAMNFLKFGGISNRDSLWPPDPNAAVGATQIVETVNTSYQVFSKAGASLLGPVEMGSLWDGFGGQCDITTSGSHYYSDPIVLYDQMAGRWLVTIIGSNSSVFKFERHGVHSGLRDIGRYGFVPPLCFFLRNHAERLP